MKYTLDRAGAVVGHSEWTWDFIYTPIVGCFINGRLEAWAECDREPLGGLQGPSSRCWFRMELGGDVHARLGAGDPSVRIKRLEDGRSLEADRPFEAMEIRRWRIEDFLAQDEQSGLIPLWGYIAFLAAPSAHKTDILFLDVLGRLPDPDGRRGYAEAVDRGVSLFDLRREMMRSEEFSARGVTISDRVGALMTSPIWNHLRPMEALGERRRGVPQLRLASYADHTDAEFVEQVYIDCHGHKPTADAVGEMTKNAELHGRRFVAGLLLRDASIGGNPMELLDA